MLCCMDHRARMEDADFRDERDEPRGFLAGMLRAAERLGDVAANAVRDGTESVAQLSRRELSRAIATYNLWITLLLFAWSAALVCAAALVMAYWDTHRVAASLCAGGALLAVAMAAAIALWIRRPARH